MEPVDAKEAVRLSWQEWLGENKRLEDYRFIVRDVERQLSELQSADFLLTGQLPGIQPSPHLAPADAECVGGAESDAAVGARSEAALDKGKADAGAGAIASRCVELRIVLGCGIRLRSLYRSWAEDGGELAVVDLFVFAQLSADDSEAPCVEFHGRRSQDLRVDESKYSVDHELVGKLQASVVPSMTRPISFLDMLMVLPLTDERSLVPFRTLVLEDMLCSECWDEDSDSDLLGDLSLGGDDGAPGSDREEGGCAITTPLVRSTLPTADDDTRHEDALVPGAAERGTSALGAGRGVHGRGRGKRVRR